MKKFLETRGGMLFCALLFTGVCGLYVAAALKNGLWEALRYPSPMASVILFAAFATLAVICWYRCLCHKPEEPRRKRGRAYWAAMSAGCFLLAGVWLVLFFRLGRSSAALTVCGLALACAAVSAVRAARGGKNP